MSKYHCQLNHADGYSCMGLFGPVSAVFTWGWYCFHIKAIQSYLLLEWPIFG